MRLTVRVPATSANLGPGFDCFGLALDLCNDVQVDLDAPPGVAWAGEGADELPTDGSDLVSRSMAAVADEVGLPLPAFSLHGHNRIPLERGLGSSSAAAVAGVVAASKVLALGIDEDPFSVFSLAAAIEGHPDNAAPAVYGGFTIVAGGAVRRLDTHPDLRPVAIVPGDVRVSTAAARAALPAQVPHADAVFNASHAALMVVALTEDPSLLGTAMQDRLHQDARLALAPAIAEVYHLLRSAHIPVCVSGSGPSLLAFERLDGPDVASALGPSSGWAIEPLPVRARGVELEVS